MFSGTPITLSSPIRYLKGVGPKKAERLAALGIETLRDLVTKTPRTWENRQPQSAQNTDKAAYLCQIQEVKESFIPHIHLAILKAKARILTTATESMDPPRPLRMLWLRRTNGRWDTLSRIREDAKAGNHMLVFGKFNEHKELDIEDWQTIPINQPPQDSPHWQKLTPVYPATEGMSQRELRELRWKTIPLWREGSSWNWNSLGFKTNGSKLINVRDAYAAIHFPSSAEELSVAQETLAFFEFFLLSLAMELRKMKMRSIAKEHQYPTTETPKLLNQLLENLKINLTSCQQEAIDAIMKDMGTRHPMNRLLQGEVGSGKTLVAIAAILKALEAGYQVAFLAPTEVLAFQHVMTLKNYLKPFAITTTLFTSELAPGKKEKIIKDIKTGAISLIVGTHAMLGNKIEFKNLALVIIDEQHRFGVNQRWQVRNKAKRPDCLVLSATPIPRSLALALHGDLEISTMEELPLGRILPKTILIKEESTAWELAKKEIELGHQIYIVVPTIEEGAPQNHSIKKTYEKILSIFPKNSIAVLHGKLSANEKEKAFKAFRDNQASIMLATTIIEVGIDVPNASTIIVLGAEHFGLATLHQLRGRVSRAQEQGSCLLLTSPGFSPWKDDFLKPSIAWERLEAFAQSRSGFEIGAMDLKMRGPGELVGLAQHGCLDFSHFDFSKHAHCIGGAQTLARAIAQKNSARELGPYLKSELEKKFGADFMTSDLS